MIVVENRPIQDHFSKVSICNFSCLKNIKKGYIEMTEKIYLETFEKCPGLVCFPLLSYKQKVASNEQKVTSNEHKENEQQTRSNEQRSKINDQ